MMHVQDLQAQSLILLFVFFGMAWVGASVLFAALWCLCMRAISRTPKLTNFKKS